jgi:hypothetical protein
MALARVQASSGVNTTFASSVQSAAFASPLTNGSIILVAWEGDGVTSTNVANTPTDTAGNTYVRVSSTLENATFDLEVWYTLNTHTTAANKVTITDTGAGIDSIIAVEEWTGAASVTPVDQQTSATSGASPSTALNSGATSATTNANDLIWVAGAAAISGNHLSLAGSFTNLTQNSTTFSNLGIASQVVSTTGAQTGVMTVSSSSSWCCAVVAIKEAPATVAGDVITNFNPGRSWINRFAKNERQIFTWPQVQGPADIPQQMVMPTFNPGQTWIRRYGPTERRVTTQAYVAPVVSTIVTPPTTALTLTTFAPVIAISIIPPTTALTITIFAPVVGLTVIPSTTALTITSYAPVIGITIIPPVKALTLLTFAPVIGLTVIPSTTALALSTFAPTVIFGTVATPGVLSLSISTFPPQLNLNVIVPTATLTLTTYTATVTVGIPPPHPTDNLTIRSRQDTLIVRVSLSTLAVRGVVDTLNIRGTADALTITGGSDTLSGSTSVDTLVVRNPQDSLVIR